MDDYEHLSNRKQHDSRLRARCPVCKAWVVLKDDIEQWDLVDCPQCSTLLELADWRPPTLSLVESGVDDDELIYEDDDDFGSSYDDDDDDLF